MDVTMRVLQDVEIPKNASELVCLAAAGFTLHREIYRDETTQTYVQTESLSDHVPDTAQLWYKPS